MTVKGSPPIPTYLEERIRILNNVPINSAGSFILYWMHHAVRTDQNPALDVAIFIAQTKKIPLLVYQGLAGRHRYNSDRHHTFIMQGARDVQRQLKDRGIRYAFYLGRDAAQKGPLIDLAHESALVITEDFPAPPFPRWTQRLAQSIDTPLWVVDTACLVPMQRVPRPYSRAFQFREALNGLFQTALTIEWPEVEVEAPYCDGALPFSDIDFSTAAIEDLCAGCDIDHSIGPVHHTPGGSEAGYARWAFFKDHGLRSYHRVRNDAAVAFPRGVSRLSAYLHHGHISPFRIAHEAAASESPGAEKFLDELLIWRELAHNLCFHRSDVESISVLPSWARQSLLDHVTDARPALYSLETLSRGETDDDLWNAAQKSLLIHGELHNNVRMTWGKSLLQWTANPQQALDYMIELNHRYALDGSDPNSYGGLLWCLGLFDRPFTPEQPVYGTVRTRSSKQHANRLDMLTYTAHVTRSPRSTRQRIAIIGAGMAGLSAARALVDNGADVHVFDKSRGPGGRMASRRKDELVFDHGAQYFTARDERFIRRVEFWIQDGLVALWEGAIGTVEQGRFEARPTEISRYVGIPRMSALTRHLAANLDITSNTRLVNATYDRDGWSLYDDSGKLESHYDGLIVTTPPVQAVQFLQDSPGLVERINEVAMRPCWAVMVAIKEKLAIPFDGLFVQNSPLSWICRNSSKPNRPSLETWVLHSAPDWAEEHLEMTPEEVLPLLMTAFSEATGIPEIPTLHAQAHRWRYALASNPLSYGALWDSSLQLAVCGDWCNNSRVEGAFLSGQSAAGRLMGLPDTVTHTPAVQLSLPGL